MCGIVGILQPNVLEYLLNGIKQLQNRGYDSAGISYLHNGKIETRKYASTEEESALIKLEQQLNNIENANNDAMNAGIAHTRWATHGGKTDANSHPHVSYDNNFTLVHNGIIENYDVLKKQCIEQGATFQSQTDSEVIVNLLAITYHNQKEKDVCLALKEVCEQLEGTWALVIMCKDFPNQLFCTRHGSPLLIGKQENIAYVVSEQSAFNNQIKDYFVLHNHDICHLYYQQDVNNNVCIKCETQEQYQTKTLTQQNAIFSPEPYSHFMEKGNYGTS
jgi:glucosamine--fructose-6-phosphate aminotransferase (isomerizing)